MTSPLRLVVRPCADGKLRRGGGGGGDLEGFSVRYRATLRSTVNGGNRIRTQRLEPPVNVSHHRIDCTDSPDPRCKPAPSILFSFWAASCTLPGCWSQLGVVVEVVLAAVVPVVPAAGEVAVVEVIGMVIWGLGGTAGLLMCLAAKSRSGMAFISSAWVSSSKRLMSWALNWVKLARFSSQSRSAA